MTIERVLAGHRVLRLLAHGDRSQVWLAAGDLALKVLTPPVPSGAPGREAEALHRARGDHVVELLDLSLGDQGAVLVFPRLPRGSLADLLLRRRALDAGEAVTILAPIASSLIRLHAEGVAHGALNPDAVLFRADGAPMLTGFGHAELFPAGIPEVERERIAGVSADRAALLGIADAVLVRTAGARAKVASRLREQLRTFPPGILAERMVEELFELATARPVRFEADDEPITATGRVVAVAASLPEPATEPTSRLPAVLARVLETGPGTIARAVVTERWAGWSAGRRRAALGAAAAGLVLVVALVAVPGPPAPGPVASPPPAVTEAHDDVTDGAVEDTAIEGDDPVAALQGLAARRLECFRELSVLCLDGVDEAGSSAWDADRDALQGILDSGGSPASLQVTGATLIERIGDSALVELSPDSDPASVLLLKGEAGWRIRDYLGTGGLGDPGRSESERG